MRGKRGLWFGAFVAAAAASFLCLVFLPATSDAAINQQISFQGKLTNPDGTNVADGSYSIRFRIYTDATLDAASSCLPGSNACKWEDSQSLTVTSGVFSYALGSNGAAPLPGSVDFNSSALYLGVKVGSDSEMLPRVQLTAAPYAFNSDKLNGISSTGFVQLGQVSGATGQTDASNNSSIYINKTSGTGNIFELQKAASDVFVIANNGDVTATGKYNTNTFTGASLQFGTASAAGIQSASGQALNVMGHAASTVSTDAGALTAQGFSGLTLSTTVQTAASTASGAITIASGNATGTTSTAGNVSIDVGSSTTSQGAIRIGTAARAQTIAIGNATAGTTLGLTAANGITLNNSTSLAASQNLSYASGAGNFDQSASTGTFKTGTGAVSLSGATTVSSTTGGAVALTVNGVSTGLSSGAVTMTAVNGNTTFTTNSSITLNAGDYIVPQTTSSQARMITVGGTGTSFTVTPKFSAGVTGEVFTIYRPTEMLNATANNVGLRINAAATNTDALQLYSGVTGTVNAAFDSVGDLYLGSSAVSGAVSTPNASGATAALYLNTGSSTTSGNTGALTLQSGNATSGTSGNVVIDNGTSTTGTPQITLGTTNARAINIGNTTAATAVAVMIGTGSSAFSVQGTGSNQLFSIDASATDTVNVGNATNGASFKNYQSAGNQASFVANNTPTVDQVSITNTGQGVTTAGVNGLAINYVGGNAAVESSGERIDVTPGGTSGGTWNGLRIVANPTGPVSGVSENGIKLEGPTAQGAGTATGLNITTGWDIGIDISSGGMQFATQSTDPGTPAAGHLKVYVSDIAGRSMLKGLGASGVDYAYQPSLFQQSVLLITPGNGTSATTWSGTGGQLATSGTLSMAAATETQGFMGNVLSGTTAGTGAGVSNSTVQYYRGSTANGADGFFFFARINLPDAIANYNSTTTGSRIFVGLSSTNIIGTTAMASSDAPAGHYAGFQYAPSIDATNFRFVTNNNTTINRTSTGVVLAVGKTYDFYIYCKPNDATNTIYWRIDNLTDGTAPVEGSTSTTVPGNTTAMRAGVALAPLSTTAHNIRIQRVYTETDR